MVLSDDIHFYRWKITKYLNILFSSDRFTSEIRISPVCVCVSVCVCVCVCVWDTLPRCAAVWFLDLLLSISLERLFKLPLYPQHLPFHLRTHTQEYLEPLQEDVHWEADGSLRAHD